MLKARVKCANKTELTGKDGGRETWVTFQPDVDERATIAMSLTVFLDGQTADAFAEGKAYTLQFVDDEPDH